MARTYRRDKLGRFAGNGNTSASARRALQTKTGALRSRRRVKPRPGNSRPMASTISQNPYQRQVDNFAREYAPPGFKNRYTAGKRKAPRLTEDNFALRPQRVGTVSRRSATRAERVDLRDELKDQGRSMADYRREYRQNRRFVRSR